MSNFDFGSYLQEVKRLRILIETWGISHKAIASKMGMNVNTFRVKINASYPQYRFFVGSSEGEGVKDELGNLKKALNELSKDIQKVCGEGVLV